MGTCGAHGSSRCPEGLFRQPPSDYVFFDHTYFVRAIDRPLLPWCHLLNAEDVGLSDSSVGAIAVAALVVSLLALPAGLGPFSVFAHQRGDLVHMVMSSGSLISLGSAGVAIWLQQPLWLVGAITLSGPLLGGVALWIMGLGNGLVPRPQWVLVVSNHAGEMTKAGFMFLLIDATTLMLLRTPDLLVAHLHGVDAVDPLRRLDACHC